MNAQVATALQRGNGLRVAGAVYRRELSALPYRDSLQRAADLLEDPPEAIQRMRIDRFIRAITRVGPDIARRMCQDLHIGSFRYVGPTANESHSHRPLSEDQRLRLAAELRRRAA